jgi:anti-sigma B factor antagonist
LALTEYSSGDVFRGVPAAFAGHDADRTVVLLHGEHDASTVTALSEHMARAIALDDADLVVDLSGVEFMDAATVRLIIRAREFLAVRSRSLTLRSPSRRARRLLDICGLDDHLDRHPVGAARVTSGVLTLALADDSTLVPSGNRATD